MAVVGATLVLAAGVTILIGYLTRLDPGESSEAPPAPPTDGVTTESPDESLEQNGPQRVSNLLDTLALGCSRNLDEEGFGHVVVREPMHITQERGIIGTPCVIDMVGRGSVTFESVEMVSVGLVLRGEESGEGTPSVQIIDSRLRGEGSASLRVELLASEGFLSIQDSTLEFGKHIAAQLTDFEEGFSDGYMDLLRATLRVRDEEGSIVLGYPKIGRFEEVTFAGGRQQLLAGESCFWRDVSVGAFQCEKRLRERPDWEARAN